MTTLEDDGTMDSLDELSEDSATFHTAGVFSSVQAIKPIAATEQAKTDFNKYFFIIIPHSKVFNPSS